MEKTQDPNLERFLEHFPQESELILQVLKGHLLVEEIVRQALNASLPNPEALEGANGATLNCHQAICILESTLPKGGGLPWIWTACKMLNRIRNSLAHKLDQDDLQLRITNFIQFCSSAQPELAIVAKKVGLQKDQENSFTVTILGLCAALSALKDSLKKRK